MGQPRRAATGAAHDTHAVPAFEAGKRCYSAVFPPHDDDDPLADDAAGRDATVIASS
jgi:hypothetical protein